MAEVARQSQLVLVEAFHYRYHPLAARMKEIINNGELGTLQRIEAWLCFPLLARNDIRCNLSLAGGATMDAGSYTINVLRFLAGEEPKVVQATARSEHVAGGATYPMGKDTPARRAGALCPGDP
jgi:predicted dehydrogenase